MNVFVSNYDKIRDRSDLHAMIEAQRLSALCAAYNNAALDGLALDGIAAAIRTLAVNIAHQINSGASELDALRLTLAGSDSAPSDAEIRQVLDAGGFWMHYSADVGVPLIERSVEAMNVRAKDQQEKGYAVRWWAFTATGELWVRP